MRVLKGNSITEKEMEKAEQQDEKIRGGTGKWPYNLNKHTYTDLNLVYSYTQTMNKYKVNINRTAHSFS